MSISSPFIRRPVATSLLMAAILLIGIAAYPLLPVAPLPRVEFPTIQVTANLPGASPETMASTVAQPLERQFAQIAGVAQMTSVSVGGSTQVVVQFDLDRNIDGAALDIQAAINNASGQLPRNLPNPPVFRKVNPADSPILILAVQSEVLPLIEVNDYADNVLSQQISQVSGVSQVTIGGEQKRAIRVQADPARLAAMNLTLEDVRQLLVTATLDGPKGTLDGANQAFSIYANDQLTKSAELNDVILSWRNGAPVRVRDIGTAVDGPENARLAGWQNGKRGIQLLIFKQPDANVIDTVERIKAALPRLRAAIPPSITVETIVDRTATIRASVHEVQFTLLLSIALVVMVIFLFLRNLWATIIPSITVPLALVGTFAVMYLVGYSLNNLTLMALTIAVGFVVDDAIVMLENIYRHIEDGVPPKEAALQGAGEIGFHHHLHQPLAHRRVHSAAADGRHRRPAVSRVRDDRRDRSDGVGVRVAYPYADDVLALPQAALGRAWPVISCNRAPFCRVAEWIPAHAGRCVAVSVRDADGVLRHACLHRLFICADTKGLLSRSG